MTTEPHTHPSGRLGVLVVGGGVAGLETILALKDLAGDRVRMTLLSPEDEFVYRPLSVAQPFARGSARRYDLGSMTSELETTFVRAAFAALDAETRTVTTTDGQTISYDVLVLAVGARPQPAFRRGLTFGVEHDPEMFNGLLADIEQGYTSSVAFIVPPGVSWSLPLYELVLMTSGQAAGMGMTDVEYRIVTPEERPLAIFGPKVSETVAELLNAAGIAITTSAYARQAGDDIVIEPEGSVLRADRVVALPVLKGPQLGGVPADKDGFIPTDPTGRVTGLEDVFAAGDGTTFPIKQGGLATQQADAVAEAIAARAGADIEARPFRPVLRGMLLTARKPQYMRNAVAGGGGEGSASSHCLWWPPTKIAGRYIAPYLTGRDEEHLLPREYRDHHAMPIEAAIRPTPHRPRRWTVVHGDGNTGFEIITDEETPAATRPSNALGDHAHD